MRENKNFNSKAGWASFIFIFLIVLICLYLTYEFQSDRLWYYIFLVVTIIMGIMDIVILFKNLHNRRLLRDHERQLGLELKKRGGHACPRCGARVGLNDVACGSCGRNLKGKR